MKRIIFLIIFTITALSFEIQSQNILVNGDMEMTSSSGCNFNPTISAFNTAMTGITLFNQDGTCIMQGDCGFGSSPQSGEYKIGPAAGFATLSGEQLAFSLIMPIQNSVTYQFSGYTELIQPYGTGILEIGVSSTNDNFGTKVTEFAINEVQNGWVPIQNSFVAPSDANFLTFRIIPVSTGQTWAHIDNFLLTRESDAIPTLSQWGLIILSLCTIIIGLNFMKLKENHMLLTQQTN